MVALIVVIILVTQLHCWQSGRKETMRRTEGVIRSMSNTAATSPDDDRDRSAAEEPTTAMPVLRETEEGSAYQSFRAALELHERKTGARFSPEQRIRLYALERQLKTEAEPHGGAA